MPKHDVVALKKAMPLLELIERHGVALRKTREGSYEGICPFHDEKTESFTVDADRGASGEGLFYCFGCGAGGDHVDFVRHAYGLEPGPAIRKLAEVVGGSAPHVNYDPLPQRPRAAPKPKKWVTEQSAPSEPPAIPATLGVKRGEKWEEFPVLAAWPYRNAAGELVGWACRVEPEPGKKDVIPVTWQTNTETGESRWRQGAMPEPRPLYGAELLAADPDAQVLCVEGEKACDAARRLCTGTGIICITWAGGSKALFKTDWSLLAGRKVVLWPDADMKRSKRMAPSGLSARGEGETPTGDMLPYVVQGGLLAMFTLSKKLIAIESPYRIVAPFYPGEAVDGWDLADAEAEGWDQARVLEFMRSRLYETVELIDADEAGTIPRVIHTEQASASNPVSEENQYIAEEVDQLHPHDREISPPADDDYESMAPPPVHDEYRQHFHYLGWDNGLGYYLPIGFRQVVPLAAGAHLKLNLLQLAPLHYWSSEFPSEKKSGDGTDWLMAANAVIQKAQRAGKYNPDLVRGRGAWWDDGRCAVHLGDCVVMDGTRYELHEVPSRFIYQVADPAHIALENPLGNEHSRLLVGLCSRLKWECPVFAKLLAGWVFLAPICGALEWRPHLWITGSSGSGKSTVMDHIVNRVLATTRLYVQGKTSEPGIRRRLKRDALPVMFDEFESETRSMEDRVQSVMGLVTQSSSETGAEILMAGGSSAESFKIRSMFIFSSIAVNLKQHAARTRVTVMGLVAEPETPETIARGDSLMKDIVHTLTAEYVDQLQARAVDMIPTIRHNAAVFSRAAATVLKTRRLGDQVGTLIAGAYALHSRAEISDEDALEWVSQQDWDQVTESPDSRDEHQCIAHILDYQLRVETGSYGIRTRSIGDLVEKLAGQGDGKDDNDISRDEAYDAMRRVGIRCEKVAGDEWVIRVAADHRELRKILCDTPWVSSWDRQLMRIPGTRKAANQRYGAKSSRGVEIPIAAIFGPNSTPTQQELIK